MKTTKRKIAVTYKDTIRSLARAACDMVISRGRRRMTFSHLIDRSGLVSDYVPTAKLMEAEIRWDIERQFGDPGEVWLQKDFGLNLQARIVHFVNMQRPPMPAWAITASENGWTPPPAPVSDSDDEDDDDEDCLFW